MFVRIRTTVKGDQTGLSLRPEEADGFAPVPAAIAKKVRKLLAAADTAYAGEGRTPYMLDHLEAGRLRVGARNRYLADLLEAVQPKPAPKPAAKKAKPAPKPAAKKKPAKPKPAAPKPQAAKPAPAKPKPKPVPKKKAAKPNAPKLQAANMSTDDTDVGQEVRRMVRAAIVSELKELGLVKA